MSRTIIDLWVGILVTIGIAALLFLSLKAGNLAGQRIEQPYAITAVFDNVGGLKVRAPVKAAGVVIGRVESIALDDQFRAKVRLLIDHRYQLSKDTYLTINTSGLLGEQYVGVMPGDPEMGVLPAGAVTTKTQSAVVLEDLISQMLFNKAAEASPAQQ